MSIKPSERFGEWLRQFVANEPAGHALPPEHELAKSFMLSRSTISRALHPYRARGDIVSIPGRGSFVREAPGDAQLIAPDVNESAWRRLEKSLLNLISHGDYRAGTALPPVKYIVKRFKVTPATVTRAYRSLVAREHAIKMGRRYIVGRMDSAMAMTSQRNVWFFTWYGPTEETVFRAANLGVSYTSMEIELQRYGAALRHFSREAFDEVIASAQRRRIAPAGFVFYNVWKPVHYEHIVHRLRDYARAIHTSIPPSLVVSVGMPFIRSSIRLLHAGNIYTMQARRCAQRIVDKGISRTAVFLPAGSLADKFVRLYPELISMAPGGMHRLVIQDPSLEPATRDREGESGQPPAGAIYSQAQKCLGRILPKYTTIDPDIAYSRMYAIDSFAHWCATHAPRSQTAWVFARTADAAAALQWARDNHIGVPSPLSIIDLENNADYYREDISSCIPDWHGVGYLMAHTLLRDIPIERSRKGYIHTRAVFLDRATTP